MNVLFLNNIIPLNIHRPCFLENLGRGWRLPQAGKPNSTYIDAVPSDNF